MSAMMSIYDVPRHYEDESLPIETYKEHLKKWEKIEAEKHESVYTAYTLWRKSRTESLKQLWAQHITQTGKMLEHVKSYIKGYRDAIARREAC